MKTRCCLNCIYWYDSKPSKFGTIPYFGKCFERDINSIRSNFCKKWRRKDENLDIDISII